VTWAVSDATVAPTYTPISNPIIAYPLDLRSRRQ